MNARALLSHVEARGASLRVEHGADGEAVLIVAPRSACVDLLPDLAKFKPELVSLLQLQHGNRFADAPPDAGHDGITKATACGFTGRDFDARAAFERLPERQGGLNRAAQVERARQSIPPRFRRLLELGDRSNGRTGEAREVWALAVAVALLDAGKSPISRAEGDFSP